MSVSRNSAFANFALRRPDGHTFIAVITADGDVAYAVDGCLGRVPLSQLVDEGWTWNRHVQSRPWRSCAELDACRDSR